MKRIFEAIIPSISDGPKMGRELPTSTAFTTLDLHNSQIDDEGAEALAEVLVLNTTLTTLSLSFNQIGVEGARALSVALATNVTLTDLSLDCNRLGAEGAKALSRALATNVTLTALNLDCNRLGDEGARALSKALVTNVALTTLNLDCNYLGDEGAKTLAEALVLNTTLTTLKLSLNQIGDQGAKALSRALTTNFTMLSLIFYCEPEIRAMINHDLNRNQSLLELAFSRGLKYCLTKKEISTSNEASDHFNVLSTRDLFLLKAHTQWVQSQLQKVAMSFDRFEHQIEAYRLQSWPQVKGWYRESTDSDWGCLPVDIQQQILSYLSFADWLSIKAPSSIGNETDLEPADYPHLMGQSLFDEGDLSEGSIAK